MVGVLATATDAKLYLDGVEDATDTDSVLYAAGVDRISIARLGDNTPSKYFNGLIAGGSRGPFYCSKELKINEVKALFEVTRRGFTGE